MSKALLEDCAPDREPLHVLGLHSHLDKRGMMNTSTRRRLGRPLVFTKLIAKLYCLEVGEVW